MQTKYTRKISHQTSVTIFAPNPDIAKIKAGLYNTGFSGTSSECESLASKIHKENQEKAQKA